MQAIGSPESVSVGSVLERFAATNTLIDDARYSYEGNWAFLRFDSEEVFAARVRRLTNRVEGVALAEAGANFLEVYRYFLAEGYDPPEGWGWCYVDEVLFDLSKRKTPHNGPIPRYY